MSDIIINGITYPSSRRVAFPGSDGKEVVFDLPEDAEAGLNGTSKRPVQNRVIYNAVQTLQQQISSPFNFKGTKATYSALPASGNTVNDTWYVEADHCRYTWTGSAWAQSSLDEGDYEDELAALEGAALRNMGNMTLSTEDNPDTVTKNGVWIAAASLVASYTGRSTFGNFINLMTPGHQVSNQIFLLSDGEVWARRGTSMPFTSRISAAETKLATKMDALYVETAVKTAASTMEGYLYDIDAMELVQYSNYSIKEYAVTPGEALHITGIHPSYKYPLYVVFDADGALLAASSRDNAGPDAAQEILIVPDKASKLYVLGLPYRPQAVKAVTFETDINNILENHFPPDILDHARRTDRTDYYGITAVWNDDGSCTVTGTNTIAVGLPMWAKTDPMPDWIVPGRTYYIKISSDTVQYNIVSYDAQDNLIQNYQTSSNSLYTIPSNTARITLQLRVPPGTHDETVDPHLLTDVPGMDILSNESSDLPLSVTVSQSGVIVREGRLLVTLQKNGANSLINLKNAYWDGDLLFATSTDWIGPYDFLAVSNADGDRLDPSKGVRSTNTTGGNHNIHTGDPSDGTPTARTVSWSVSADGKSVTPGNEISCSHLLVRWVNRVQAGNTAKLTKDADGYGTGRECLEEHCFAEFCGGGLIRVGVDFVPLEAIRMQWYSGLQFAGSGFAPKLHIQEYEAAPIDVSYLNDHRNTDEVRYVDAIGDTVSLEMYMDRDFGVGRRAVDYSYSGGSNGTGVKGYFLLFSRGQNPVDMAAGERYAWRGHYRFYPSL